MTPPVLYTITILVHGEMETGINPEFDFEDRKKAMDFMETCLDNHYFVQVNKQQLAKE